MSIAHKSNLNALEPCLVAEDSSYSEKFVCLCPLLPKLLPLHFVATWQVLKLAPQMVTEESPSTQQGWI